ncbi:MAG TPA: ABC transporter substrate-binding protein, partial [Terriglobales bacterium]
MNYRISVVFAAVLMFLGPPLLAQQSAPYKPGEAAPLTYNGPGREVPDPEVDEVRLLYFGPADASDSLWNGARLAIEDANREGGYHGKPYRLVPVWDANPWTGGVGKLARAVESEKAWAIIGGTDGATIHLAAQVTTRLPIVVLNAAATDRSIHNANVPWIFSCVPGDQAISASMAKSIRGPFILLSGTDHDSRSFVSQLSLAMTAEHISPSARLEVGQSSDYKTIAADAIAKKAAIIVLVAPANEIGAILNTLATTAF